MTADAVPDAEADDPADTDDAALIGGALRSRDEDAAPWTVAWGVLPPGRWFEPK